jgi:hypothetical protein
LSSRAVAHLDDGREAGEAAERALQARAIPRPSLPFIEGAGGHVVLDDPQDRATDALVPQGVDGGVEQSPPDAPTALLEGNVDGVDLADARVVVNADLPLHEADDGSRPDREERAHVRGPGPQRGVLIASVSSLIASSQIGGSAPSGGLGSPDVRAACCERGRGDIQRASSPAVAAGSEGLPTARHATLRS